MIKIKTSPMVLAAALGLLGPAALADDDDDAGDTPLAGMWERSGDAEARPARLAAQIHLLPLEDAYVLDEGRPTTASPRGSWRTDGAVVQTFELDGASVSREFQPDGDAMTVRTVITQQDAKVEYTDVYTRIS